MHIVCCYTIRSAILLYYYRLLSQLTIFTIHARSHSDFPYDMTMEMLTMRTNQMKLDSIFCCAFLGISIVCALVGWLDVGRLGDPGHRAFYTSVYYIHIQPCHATCGYEQKWAYSVYSVSVGTDVNMCVMSKRCVTDVACVCVLCLYCA